MPPYKPPTWTKQSHAVYSMPAMLTCSRCRKLKNTTAFSTSQKNKLLSAAGRMEIPCMQCTGVTLQELYCNGCNITKGLDEFSSVQRRSDDSKCLKCITKQVNYEPGDADTKAIRSRRQAQDQAAEEDMIYGVDTLDVGESSRAGSSIARSQDGWKPISSASSHSRASEMNTSVVSDTASQTTGGRSSRTVVSHAPSDGRRFAKLNAPPRAEPESESEEEIVTLPDSDSDSGSAVSL